MVMQCLCNLLLDVQYIESWLTWLIHNPAALVDKLGSRRG